MKRRALVLEQSVCGSVWLLSVVPWPVIYIGIAFLSTGMVLLLRFMTEGKIYDRARSSTPGDLFLAGYCATVACYLQSVGTPKIDWHIYAIWDNVVFVSACLIACGLHETAKRRNEAERRFTLLPAQKWHNLVVVPLLLYLIVSTGPIVVMAKNPRLLAITATSLAVWVSLVVWDIAHGNMVQIKE